MHESSRGLKGHIGKGGQRTGREMRLKESECEVRKEEGYVGREGGNSSSHVGELW